LIACFLSNKLFKCLKKKEDKRKELIDNYFRELLEKDPLEKKRKKQLDDGEGEAVG
jgi:hypothetical protein